MCNTVIDHYGFELHTTGVNTPAAKLKGLSQILLTSFSNSWRSHIK